MMYLAWLKGRHCEWCTLLDLRVDIVNDVPCVSLFMLFSSPDLKENQLIQGRCVASFGNWLLVEPCCVVCWLTCLYTQTPMFVLTGTCTYTHLVLISTTVWPYVLDKEATVRPRSFDDGLDYPSVERWRWYVPQARGKPNINLECRRHEGLIYLLYADNILYFYHMYAGSTVESH